MSFYIKVDNPNHHKTVEPGQGISGFPVEGPTKTCLVTAFTSVVGDPKAAYVPDRKYANKDLGFVAVSLADHGTITLPFPADEFEALVLDAQQKNRIADFTCQHWLERLDDLRAFNAPQRFIP